MTWLLFLAALVLFLCGMLAGAKFTWMDAYYKGREDALKPFRPVTWPPPR